MRNELRFRSLILLIPEKKAIIVATRAHKFSSRFITPLLRLRLLKYNYAENPKARQKMPRASKLGWAFI